MPPRIALWLATHLIRGERNGSLLGDLVEQHQKGRSSLWFWRETVTAIVVQGLERRHSTEGERSMRKYLVPLVTFALGVVVTFAVMRTGKSPQPSHSSLPLPGSLTGIVFDSNGVPVPNASVMFARDVTQQKENWAARELDYMIFSGLGGQVERTQLTGNITITSANPAAHPFPRSEPRSDR